MGPLGYAIETTQDLRAAWILLMRHSRKSENHLVEIMERHNGIAGHQ